MIIFFGILSLVTARVKNVYQTNVTRAKTSNNVCLPAMERLN